MHYLPVIDRDGRNRHPKPGSRSPARRSVPPEFRGQPPCRPTAPSPSSRLSLPWLQRLRMRTVAATSGSRPTSRPARMGRSCRATTSRNPPPRSTTSSSMDAAWAPATEAVHPTTYCLPAEIGRRLRRPFPFGGRADHAPAAWSALWRRASSHTASSLAKGLLPWRTARSSADTRRRIVWRLREAGQEDR
jgi:hypothetical protein